MSSFAPDPAASHAVQYEWADGRERVAFPIDTHIPAILDALRGQVDLPLLKLGPKEIIKRFREIGDRNGVGGRYRARFLDGIGWFYDYPIVVKRIQRSEFVPISPSIG